MSDPSQLTDEELMVQYQAGNESAFQELYKRHSAKTFGYVKKKLPPGEVDDCFQAAYLKLHKSRHLYDSRFPFQPWLFTVISSVIKDHLKNRKVSPEPLTEEHESRVSAVSAVSAVLAKASEGPDLDIDLSALSSQQRRAIELRYSHNLTFEEIASRLETSPANIRQIISRSIRQLRAALSAGGENEKKQ